MIHLLYPLEDLEWLIKKGGLLTCVSALPGPGGNSGRLPLISDILAGIAYMRLAESYPQVYK